MAMFEKKAPVVNHTHENGHTQTIETIIGSGATFQGTIITKTALRIDGIIQGDVQSTNTVIIGEDGIVRGTVNAGDMLIAGTIEGNVISAGRTEFVPGGYLKGDIQTGELIIQQGAGFEGNCKTNTPQGKATPVQTVGEDKLPAAGKAQEPEHPAGQKAK